MQFSGRDRAHRDAVSVGVLAGGALGALMLLVAELTTLFYVRAVGISRPVESIVGGPHHDYALVPIAALATVFAFASFRYGSRPAAAAIGVLGLITLGIALLGDLPDAQATGLVTTRAAHYVTASARPSTGMYLETLGAVILIITSGAALLLAGPAVPRSLRSDREGSGTSPRPSATQPSRTERHAG